MGYEKKQKSWNLVNGKRIAEQIIIQIGRNVVFVLVVIAVVAIFMMRSVLMDAKETELTLESQSMSHQLAEFFGTYTSMTEEMALQKLRGMILFLLI